MNITYLYTLGILQEWKWAAEDNVTDDDGKDHAVAIGGFCDLCFQVGRDVLGYSDMEKFNKGCAERKDLKEKAMQARRSLDAQQSAESAPEEPSAAPAVSVVRKGVELEVEVQQRVRAYSDLALRKLVDVNRLTKANLKDVPEITCPSLTQPGTCINLFAFKRMDTYPHDDEGQDVTIKARVRYDIDSKELAEGHALYDGHAQELYERKAAQFLDTDGFASMFLKGAGLIQLADFLCNYQKAPLKRKAEALTLVAATEGKKLQGRAASAYAWQDEVEKPEGDIMQDTSMLNDEENEESPNKKRRQKGVAASSAAAGSVAGGSVACESEEEGGDISDDELEANGDHNQIEMNFT
jgi:hypothetical protein